MATTAIPPTRRPPQLVLGEILSFAYDTFCSNKVRFALTALGMVIGTASLILVVTIGMTGKQYVLNQIQSIGANLIDAEYQGGAQRNVTPDLLTIDDMNAVLQQVPGIVAASPVVPLDDRIPIGGGKERDLRTLGVFPEYTACVIWWCFREGSSMRRTNRRVTKSASCSRKWPRTSTGRWTMPSAKP